MLTDVDIMLFLQEDKTILLYFTAPWCEPCKAYGPVIERYAKEHPTARFYKIDTSENPRLAAAYHVMSLPTTILFKKDMAPKALIGTATMEKLSNYMGL